MHRPKRGLPLAHSVPLLPAAPHPHGPALPHRGIRQGAGQADPPRIGADGGGKQAGCLDAGLACLAPEQPGRAASGRVWGGMGRHAFSARRFSAAGCPAMARIGPWRDFRHARHVRWLGGFWRVVGRFEGSTVTLLNTATTYHHTCSQCDEGWFSPTGINGRVTICRGFLSGVCLKKKCNKL